ncbi:MAG: hypothetical protein HQ523_08745 [Lentisphaerae bacterium]|nr:hypothetical protein [Lentisphaerota bacterium]
MRWRLQGFAHKEVVFIGRGREGLSFERFITEHGKASSFRFIDQRDGPGYLEQLRQVDPKRVVVVKTPGCPGATVPFPYTTATNLFFDCVRQVGAVTIGVTGTKGKSTTAAMIGAILKQSGRKAVVCGNIGIPMLDVLDSQDDPPDADTLFVVELSSYQLADMVAGPHVGVITNLYEDHMPYHGGVEAYWDAKRNIVRQMDGSGVLVYNPEFERVNRWIETTACRGLPIDPQAHVDMRDWIIWGDHNRLNALLAVAAAGVVGVTEAESLGVLRSFEPLPHRLQTVGSVNGVTFIDNAIGGNPAATVSAMTAVKDAAPPLGCMMVGGVDRNYDFTELGRHIQALEVPSLVLFPDTGPMIRAALPDDCRPACFETRDMDVAVQWAAQQCPAGSICLLSPASPAQTFSTDFEDLGRMFAESVRRLV